MSACFAQLARPLTLACALVGALIISLSLTCSRARASGIELCDGYSSCETGHFTDNNYPADEYTSYWRMDAGDECTNYVAYVESTVYGVTTPDYLLGNAGDWAYEAAAHGVSVNSTPSAGSVAVWDSYATGIGSFGHVAVVQGVGPHDSYVEISQQNINTSVDGFNWERIDAGSGSWQPWPSEFIHFSGTRMPDLVRLRARVRRDWVPVRARLQLLKPSDPWSVRVSSTTPHRLTQS